MSFDTNADYTNKCRVCLQKGTIPIYGTQGASIGEAVKLFAGIDLTEHHRFPRFLCLKCLSLLKGAIAFRKQARKTDDKLKQLQPCFKDGVLSDAGSADYQQQTSFTADDESGKAPSCTKTSQTKNDTKTLQCRICKKTITKNHYRSHLKTIHNIGNPPSKQSTMCRVCKENVMDMKQHMLDAHGIIDSDYICDVCGRQFLYKHRLREHLMIHCNNFPFKCQLCQYRAKKSDTLKVHMASHTREYSYKCSECPKRFQSKSNRSRHMRQHKEPKFKCEMCSRAFHTPTIKERHYQADHMGLKDYVCSVCQKGFGTRFRLTQHELRVHKREKRQNGIIPAYLSVEQKHVDAVPK